MRGEVERINLPGDEGNVQDNYDDDEGGEGNTPDNDEGNNSEEYFSDEQWPPSLRPPAARR